MEPDRDRSLGTLRWAHRRPSERTWDVVIVVLLAGLTVAQLSVQTARHHPDLALALLAGLGAVVPLLWRRRAPLLVFALSGTLVFVAVVAGVVSTGGGLAGVVALYTVDTRTDRRASLGASGLAGVAVLVAAYSRPALSWTAPIGPVAVIAALWIFGDNLRVRRAYVRGLEERAERIEAERRADALRAASEERARIARELHDVVAHHVSVIAVQAGAGRIVSDGRSPERDDLLRSIETTARDALGELRRLLGVLRRPPGESAGLAPQPGLSLLPTLATTMREAGLPLTVETVGSPYAVPSGLDLSAYRIIQEALTNVLKHNGAAPTTVGVNYGSWRLGLTVINERGPATPAAAGSPPGHGLIGMRERVNMLGGSFRAGSDP